MNSDGRSVRLFMVDGSVSGLMTAEIINWTGHALHAPRSRLSDVLGRNESEKTGLYMLFGDAAETGARRPVYIGESDNVGRRLQQHARDETKDFFERFCVITSKDANLTKAHARYLESRLSEIARSSGRAEVLNRNEPPTGALPEADIADMEYFLSQIRIVVGVLGYNILKEPLRLKLAQKVQGSDTLTSVEADAVLELELKKTRDGIQANALEKDGDFVVLKGSLARIEPANADTGYADLRETLIQDGRLQAQPNGQFLEFIEDVSFSSPSAASAVIFGRADNGRTSWIVRQSGLTLKEHQLSLAEAAE